MYIFGFCDLRDFRVVWFQFCSFCAFRIVLPIAFREVFTIPVPFSWSLSLQARRAEIVVHDLPCVSIFAYQPKVPSRGSVTNIVK